MLEKAITLKGKLKNLSREREDIMRKKMGTPELKDWMEEIKTQQQDGGLGERRRGLDDVIEN